MKKVKFILSVFGTVVILTGAFTIVHKMKNKDTKAQQIALQEFHTSEVDGNEAINEEFNITDEQVAYIQFASELFDYMQREKDGYNTRKGYTLDLTDKKTSKKILNEVASGIICIDSSLGIETTDSNGNLAKEIDIQECQKFLENTFGCQVKQSDINDIFGNKMDGDMVEINYTDPYEEHTIYETRRFAQEKEDEYHFYTEVKVKQEGEAVYSYNGPTVYRTVGIMDITAHKNDESKIGGYIFDKIEFQLNDGNGINYEIDNILNQLVRSQADSSSDKDSKYTKDIYEIDKLSDEDFRRFIAYVIESTNLVKSREVKLSNGIFDGYTISKDEYEEFCKEIFGKSSHTIMDGTEETTNKIHIAKFDKVSDHQTNNSRIIQKLNGKVSISGVLPYDLSRSSGVDFLAEGYANENSAIGITIKKLTLESCPDSKNVSDLTKSQKNLIKKRLGIPESLDTTIDEKYAGVRSDTNLRIIGIKVLVNHESVAEAEVDSVSGEFVGDVHVYKEEKSSAYSESSIFTDEQIAYIKEQLGVPDFGKIKMIISDSPYYWSAGECTLVCVSFVEDGEYVAGANVNVDTAECTTSLYTYMPKE